MKSMMQLKSKLIQRFQERNSFTLCLCLLSFLILDELDSGLDIDSLKLVCKNVLSYKKEMNASILLITHYNRILTYLKPDFVHILLEGKIVATGDYSLVEIVEKNGYNAFKNSEYKVSEAVKNE